MAASPHRDGGPAVHRGTLRLTFRVADGDVRLVATERLDMICPPSIGEPLEAGKHGGFWLELRDENDRVLFHRVLHSPLGDSVAVHSPGRGIERIFGEPKATTFEVLLPDLAAAGSIVLMGESLAPAVNREPLDGGSVELKRFKPFDAEEEGKR